MKERKKGREKNKSSLEINLPRISNKFTMIADESIRAWRQHSSTNCPGW